VAVLLMALKPLRKTSRMDRIAAAISEMSDEECYYWFSKCLKNNRQQSACRALRVLVG